MTAVLDETWGPYIGAADAKAYLTRFVDRACGADVGIVWTSQGAIHPLRAPVRDGYGVGVVAMFEWVHAPPPPPKPPTGWRAIARSWIHQILMAQYQSSMAEAQANLALGQAISRGVDTLMKHHADDAAGVAIDIIAVAAFILLLPTGVSEIAFIGVAGGVVLLATDGAAFALEMSGDEEGAERVKKRTETIRLVATVMTLPDLLYGGYKVVREMREIKELVAADRATGAAANNLARRTATAQRADRYMQIVERANLRAQLRSEQLTALLRLEIRPRGAGVGGIGLFVRDEIINDGSLMHQLTSRLQMTCVAVHKQC